ncbi:MAG: inosine/xanthosine triphosphatase [Chloroflexi bacterium]|nr:inosine/xanthosine triphosphatase [Chloroflexota bacterium]MBP7590559.1 inosine/xanthosine triphosphatase [Chloroflexota bacterium]
MKIAVGSTNPVKLTAVQSIVQQLWPDAEVTAVSVPTGVSEMPLSDSETITGARNRARAARAAINADLGFGLEGGVHPDPIGLVLQGWVVVTDGNGREGIAGAGRLPLPPMLAQRILAGEELGPVMDELLGENNVKAKGGAIGALTGGLIPRQQAFALGVAYALAPFVAPEFYDGVSR